MVEILAAFLLVAGAAIALIAAIGVARLPDAFLRMHAATKAGVVGSALLLLGAGLAFGTPEAWMRIVAIVVFLLVTVPISSHALGRAAYLGGAAMWSGTHIDELDGVLQRNTIDLGALPKTAAVTSPGDAPFSKALDHKRPRVLLALAQGPESEAALLAGLRIVAPHRAEVTILSLLCATVLAQTGSVPLGGAHYAQRLVDKRLTSAREQAADLAARMEAACEAAELPAATRHEEGDALRLLLLASAYHDVTILPRGAWFDQAQVLDAGMAESRARSLALPGLLLATPALSEIRALHFLHEADEASGEALKRFLGLDIFGDLPLTISILDLPGAEALLADAVALAATRGRAVRPGRAKLDAEHPAPMEAFSGPTLAIIPARPAGGHAAWRSLRDMPHGLLLA